MQSEAERIAGLPGYKSKASRRQGMVTFFDTTEKADECSAGSRRHRQ